MRLDTGNKTHGIQSGRYWPLLIALLLLPVSAFAYLDPTTGSMLISAIVGLFASLVLAIKTYWYRIRKFFQRKPAETRADDEST